MNGYKAPEIYLGTGYSGEQADIFAAGVILFFLVFRTIPFREAKPTDSVYKCIVNNRIDLFWRWHQKQFTKMHQQALKTTDSIYCADKFGDGTPPMAKETIN